jgi:Uma2 family endonuclease
MPIAKLKIKEKKLYTIAEYLEMERESLERHEFIDGEIFLMAGESNDHGIISVNLTSEIHRQLKGKDCQARVKDAKIKSGGFTQKAGQSTKGRFSYPDLVVICGEVELYDKKKDIILNPKVIIEVLSESTEIFDRNDKFTRYKMFNETLTDYILVSQDKPQIEHFIRQDDNSWKVYTYIGLDKICRIESIECELKLSEVYDRIKFSKKTLNFLEEIENIK